jgi:peptidyl-prolyl cis-trans isomerase B (cyclophilin B)
LIFPACFPILSPAVPPIIDKGEQEMKVSIATSMGIITAELDEEKAPLTVANFAEYAREGHYDGTIFHRVIPGFMVQGGGFARDMSQKATRAPIKNEAKNGLKNLRGTLAMARTSQVHSATSQFFINLVDNGFLDHKNVMPDGFGYCVFGAVTGGMEVVDAIAQSKTGTVKGHGDVPLQAVTLDKVTVL